LTPLFSPKIVIVEIFLTNDVKFFLFSLFRENSALPSSPVEFSISFHGRFNMFFRFPLSQDGNNFRFYACLPRHPLFFPPTFVFWFHIVHGYVSLSLPKVCSPAFCPGLFSSIESCALSSGCCVLLTALSSCPSRRERCIDFVLLTECLSI